MITVITDKLTETDKSQIARRDRARDLWAEGRLEEANALLSEVIAEGMTPYVAVRCYIAQAAFRAEAGDYQGSLQSLDAAAGFIDSADLHFQGAFYNQRARAHKELGRIDAALTDYTGAAACWETIGDPDYGAAVLNLAGLYLEIGDIAAARLQIENAITIFVETNSIYLCQGYDTWAQIELAHGNIESAQTLIQTALDLVGDNERWRSEFLHTKDKIEIKLLELLGINQVEDFETVQAGMVRRALIKTGGNLTRAGKLVGLTHKGVTFVVDRHPDLEQYRVTRRTRLKSIFKKTK